ncbi:MAG: DUF6390 family protein [bacterium]
MSGLKIAALYGLAPHRLGLCGPKEAARQNILRRFLGGKVQAAKARKVLEGFRGAYPYYRLIARSNKIKDPLNEKVVRAYWIGNKLLDNVKNTDLKKMIAGDFSRPGLLSENMAAKKAELIGLLAKPHHSFHVLAIGSVTGSVDFVNTKLKDICRPGWGRVTRSVIPAKAGIQVKKSGFRVKHGMTKSVGKITVEYQPLVGEKRIKLGKPVKKEVFWDKTIVPEIKIGDWVSFHWNWLVEVLKRKDVENLKKYTLNTLRCLK